MAIAHDQLPDDIEQLKRLLLGREALIAKLMAEIARLKRWRFGRSSERTDAALAQLQLLLEGLQFTPPASAPQVEARARLAAEESKVPAAAEATGSSPRARQRGQLPAHLPRETIVHTPSSCACPDCGSPMRTLGEDIAEQLDYVPGYFRGPAPRPAEARLRPLRADRAVAGPGAANRTRPADPGAAGAGDRLSAPIEI